MLDPNWFYSTLAQSTAAIVGLAGGFLVQRLFVQRSEIAVAREPVRRLCRNVMGNVLSLRQNVDEVIGGMEAAVAQLDERGGDAVPAFTSHELWTLNHSRSYAHPGTGETTWPQPSEDDLQALRSALSDLRALRAALPSSFEEFLAMLVMSQELEPRGAAWLMDKAEPFPELDFFEDFWQFVARQRDMAKMRWQEALGSSREAGSAVAEFRSRLVPRSFYWLVGILAGLLAAGVISPLFFLSSKDGASKPVLLTAFIPLSLAFIVFAVYELSRIRAAGDLTREAF